MALFNDTVNTIGTVATGATKNGLKFITGYRYASTLLKMINNITFLYNPNWEMDSRGEVTLPIAFFHVIKMNEVEDSEVQTKKVMFYNSQNGYNSNVVKGSTINVIADNIVNKPKLYKLDVIIPYDNITLMFNSSALTSNQLSAVTSAMGNSTMTDYRYTVKNVETARKLITMLVTTLQSLSNLTSVSTWVTNVTSVPMFNKNSLEAMRNSRSVLKMKLWNGWKFVYVAIKDIDIHKESTEDGVERATITCTELPIMVMHTKASSTGALSSFSSFVKSVNDKAGVAVKAVAKTIAGGW